MPWQSIGTKINMGMEGSQLGKVSILLRESIKSARVILTGKPKVILTRNWGNQIQWTRFQQCPVQVSGRESFSHRITMLNTGLQHQSCPTGSS